MKIWLKMCIAIIIGIIISFFIPTKIQWLNELIKFLSEIGLNLLLFFTVAYTFNKIYLGYYELQKEKNNIFFVFFIFVIISLLFSIILSIGFMNLSVFQPDSNFKVFQIKSKQVETRSFYDIFLTIINSNFITSLTSPAKYLLPVIFIAIIFSISTFKVNKKGFYFIEFITSFDAIIGRIVKHILEFFPFFAIFIIIYLFSNNIFSNEFSKTLTNENINFSIIYKPLFTIFFIILILLLFYIILLYIIIRKNIFKLFIGLLGASLISFVSGNNLASIIALNEHLKKNIGVKNSISDFLTPIGMILNRSGTVIVSTIVLMTILFTYHINNLSFSIQFLLILLIFLFSFRIDGINESGFLAIIAMVLQYQPLHFEQNSYLLFWIFVPVLSRIALLFDTITTGFLIIFCSKLNDSIEEKKYIDFI